MMRDSFTPLRARSRLLGAEHGLRHSVDDRFETPGRRIAHQQAAGGNPKVGAMQGKPAALHQDPYPWESHQILEAQFDRGEFEPTQVGAIAAARTEARSCRGNLRHPAADE